MYFAMIFGLMLVGPLASTLIEGGVTGWSDGVIGIAGPWWIFWGIGLRLFIAGISQIIRPDFTAKNILGHDDEGATHIVSELGYANLGLGAAGVLTLVFPVWAPAAGFAGGVFLFVAGVRHLFAPDKNGKEWLALVSDLFVGVIALIYVGFWIAGVVA